MRIKVFYNYILKRLGIRELLPGDILRSKEIRECNEEMVALNSGNGIFMKEETLYCRKSVADKLLKVAKRLNDNNLGLFIYEIYRSPEQQRARYEITYNNLKATTTDEKELAMLVRRSTAGVGGGHQTGGAVDLTLCDNAGVPLDMGSKYPEKCKEMVTSYHISDVVDKNRKLLCKLMREEGFANYPNEWWHFAYGDQLWAAYKNKRYAIYGVYRLPGCAQQ